VNEPTATDDLVARARAGELDAYDQLFARLAERLLLYICLRMSHQLLAKAEPMDVLQEAYAQAHRDFAGFVPQGPNAFSGWVYRIVDNCLRDLARQQGAQKRQAAGGEVRVSGVWEILADSETGPATAAGRDEHHRQLSAAMDLLETDEREAILLRHFRERSLADVAEALGISETSARRLLDRARIKLGSSLRGGR